jgi:hypothetical protein
MFSGEVAIEMTSTIAGLTPSGTCYTPKSIMDFGGFPKMSSNRTPNDWSILVLAAFNGFEFEMIDRMIFTREYASTAVGGINNKQRLRIANEALTATLGTLTEEQGKKLVQCMVKTCDWYHYPLIKKHLTTRQKLSYFRHHLRFSPAAIYRALNALFVKF